MNLLQNKKDFVKTKSFCKWVEDGIRTRDPWYHKPML